MRSAGVVTIQTHKPFGPAPGIFASSGTLPDSGTFMNSSVIIERSDHRGLAIVHVTQRFDGALGSFMLHAAITETATADRHILTDHGIWTIIDGSGAYETLQGCGRVMGSADDKLDLISRTYSGEVRCGRPIQS